MKTLVYWILIVVILSVPAAAGWAAPAAPDAGTTKRVSLTAGGNQANNNANSPSISADGRFVAFESDATNLVIGDTNTRTDVFVRDLIDGTTERVSVADNETQGNLDSGLPSISADGRFVAFASDSTNLVPGDSNARTDVFVRDRQNGTTERISLDSNETQGNANSTEPSISADGNFIAFRSDSVNLVPVDGNGDSDIFIRDRLSGATAIVSVSTAEVQGNAFSSAPSISADSRYIAFRSLSTNLVADDGNPVADIFVRDRIDGITERVSLASDGTEANDESFDPSISADGSLVVFASLASNLVPGDTNGAQDIFLHDRGDAATVRISLSGGGAQANDASFDPTISDSGLFVVFVSAATNLAVGDTNALRDIFVRDRLGGTTELVSLASSGIQGNFDAAQPDISADGHLAGFSSRATNLVPGDTNAAWDVFVRDRLQSWFPVYLPLAVH